MHSAAVTNSMSKRALGLWVVGVMTSFSLAVVATTIFVVVRHPSGAIIYLFAALPTIPIFFMMGLTSVLIRQEKDEFKRVVMVRSLLWAIAGTLAMSLFTGYLREFGAAVKVPPYLEFVAFWLMFGLARVTYAFRNRADDHD